MNIKKIILATFLSIALIFSQSGGGYVLALTPPSAPSAPSAPSEPTPPPAPEGPTAPPSAPSAPTPPPKPGEATPTPTPTQSEPPAVSPAPQNTESSQQNTDSSAGSETDGATGNNADAQPLSETQQATTGSGGENETDIKTGQVDNGNVGDTTINTGNATNTATLATSANTNSSATQPGGGGSATVSNTGNGSGSTNNGSAAVLNDDTSVQDNSATVVNNLNQSANTGDNSASRNVGGDSIITTGDANVTGTSVTAVNTNIDNVMVAEFNIADDHMGDYVLDFAANCVSGCGTGDATVKNSGNGEGSNNSASLEQISNDLTFQNNDATVENNMTLAANSGNNIASKNTGGDSQITTGDANVSANALTFANSNLAGNVVYAVVNIFGDLVGDIIFPDSVCCGGGASVANSGNGDGSTNTADAAITNTDNTFQFNNADIQNNVVLNANTGNNDTSRNTQGNSVVETGNASVDANIVNVANTNVVGDVWLVIVNEAGKWIGKILGAPEGALMAGSTGTQFEVDENGQINITNSGNGSGSTNTGSVNSQNNSVVSQTNNAKVVNNIDLSANTGGNMASRNTGGNSYISTGDAKVITNIVNFVNNNIAGSGRLFVTVVNVFGSWLGDFVSPGTHKQNSSNNIASSFQTESANDVGRGGLPDDGSQPEDSLESLDNSGNGEEKSTYELYESEYEDLVNDYDGGRVAAILGEVKDTSRGSGTPGESQDAIASSISESVKTAGKKTVNINLGVLIPIFGLALLVGAYKKRGNIGYLLMKAKCYLW